MSLTSFIAAYVLVAMTPGPNMAVVAQASLRHGRRRALMAAAGVALGAAALTVCVITAAVHVPRPSIDSRSFGALYGLLVIWMGVSCLGNRGNRPDRQSSRAGFCQAMIVALLNPYTALLILTYTSGAEPAQIRAAAPGLVLSVFLIAGCWLSCVALGLSSRLFTKANLGLRMGLVPVIGILLIGLGTFSVLQALPV
ncbi:LysE family translocator [Neotabrizicola sp. VNH66]|uniref:LysE family translocator n=1 Tax=Neotabrizicola sp. VNH66 TaxID=3400918 RepID=UPI003C011EDC